MAKHQFQTEVNQLLQLMIHLEFAEGYTISFSSYEGTYTKDWKPGDEI